MPGAAIGIALNVGFPGTVSKQGFNTITPRQVRTTDAAGPNFGAPVVINADNTVTDVATFIAAPLSGTLTMANFDGIAVRETKTMPTFPPTTQVGNYAPAQVADILRNGAITVVCSVGTPVANGAVYIRMVVDGAIPAGIVGGFEYRTDDNGGKCLLITNARWKTGQIDGNRVAELELLSKVNA